jgi:hypothetical protein
MSKTIKATMLDEVELYLNLAKANHPELIENKTYKQISDGLNKRFEITSTEDDIFLLHEPSVDELEEDLRIHFESIGLQYQ